MDGFANLDSKRDRWVKLEETDRFMDWYIGGEEDDDAEERKSDEKETWGGA